MERKVEGSEICGSDMAHGGLSTRNDEPNHKYRC